MYSDEILDYLTIAIKTEKENAIKQHGYFKNALECENALSEELCEFLAEANQAQKIFSDWIVTYIAYQKSAGAEYLIDIERFNDLTETLQRALVELIQVLAVVDKIRDYRIDE